MGDYDIIIDDGLVVAFLGHGDYYVPRGEY